MDNCPSVFNPDQEHTWAPRQPGAVGDACTTKGEFSPQKWQKPTSCGKLEQEPPPPPPCPCVPPTSEPIEPADRRAHDACGVVVAGTLGSGKISSGWMLFMANILTDHFFLCCDCLQAATPPAPWAASANRGSVLATAPSPALQRQ
jgi:hypothetical protein